MTIIQKTMRVFNILVSVGIFSILMGCQPSGPSVLKVFVRNNSNMLERNAEVFIILEPNEYVNEYFTKLKTNESGYAVFDLEELFAKYGKAKEKLAYFKVHITAENGKQAQGILRARGHNTSVHTIFLVE